MPEGQKRSLVWKARLCLQVKRWPYYNTVAARGFETLVAPGLPGTECRLLRFPRHGSNVGWYAGISAPSMFRAWSTYEFNCWVVSRPVIWITSLHFRWWGSRPRSGITEICRPSTGLNLFSSHVAAFLPPPMKSAGILTFEQQRPENVVNKDYRFAVRQRLCFHVCQFSRWCRYRRLQNRIGVLPKALRWIWWTQRKPVAESAGAYLLEIIQRAHQNNSGDYF
jgi:hypothetical protein